MTREVESQGPSKLWQPHRAGQAGAGPQSSDYLKRALKPPPGKVWSPALFSMDLLMCIDLHLSTLSGKELLMAARNLHLAFPVWDEEDDNRDKDKQDQKK